MNKITKEKIIKVIREEVFNCIEIPFSNEDDFIDDLKMISDDLTSMCLVVEKRLGIKIPREEYKNVRNVRDYAEIFMKYIS